MNPDIPCTSPLPFAGLRIAERSKLLTGRLIGQMFADQGANVFVERDANRRSTSEDDYLDRNKIAVDLGELSDPATMDVVIVDGTQEIVRQPRQFVLRVVAALPGDTQYGHLPPDCSEDLLSALVGFFTDMAQTGRLLGRDAIYTPLPLCSVYAAVNGANHLAAALHDRQRGANGRELFASRLAGGVSAVGALSLKSEGVAPHLQPGKRSADIPNLQSVIQRAKESGEGQLWLEQHAAPLATPYKAKDGTFVMCIGAANSGLARRMLQGLGIYEDVLAAGFVEKTPFRPENIKYRGINLSESTTLDWAHRAQLCDMVSAAFLQRSASEWEELLCTEFRVPCVKIQSWTDWKNDEAARDAGIFASVLGHTERQIGRAGWVASARPYPPLQACRRGTTAGTPLIDLSTPSTGPYKKRPLEGLTVVDFSNVIAGPNCGRMFAELGAKVCKVDPVSPRHSPEIVVAWAGESGAGKQSVIVDHTHADGKAIIDHLVSACDVVIANKLDDQWERMGIGREALDSLKSGIVQVALTGHRGETGGGARHDYPAYDPAVQGLTGIMMRFGPLGCPAFHGLASCVDYLCGYLGVWAGLCALNAQKNREDGQGDWAETSLAAAATLTQCMLQWKDEPASARGPHATGTSAGERLYQVADGWIFAQGDRDMGSDLHSMSRADAIQHLAQQEIAAVPVQTCAALAERHLTAPSHTIAYESRISDGWRVGAFGATWFAEDGIALGSPAPAHRSGADTKHVASRLGYSADKIEHLIAVGALGAVEFANAREEPAATEQ